MPVQHRLFLADILTIYISVTNMQPIVKHTTKCITPVEIPCDFDKQDDLKFKSR